MEKFLWQRSRKASKGGINAKEGIIHYKEVGEVSGVKNVSRGDSLRKRECPFPGDK